jgi:hypothetical protein
MYIVYDKCSLHGSHNRFNTPHKYLAYLYARNLLDRIDICTDSVHISDICGKEVSSWHRYNYCFDDKNGWNHKCNYEYFETNV